MKKKIYMTVTEAVRYLLGKDEQIDAGIIDSITFENGDLTFTFKDGSTKVVTITNTTQILEVEDIEALTDEQLENLKAGDIVLKLTNNMKHTYIVTYKEDRVGLCLSYFDFGYSETVSYDYDSENEAWTLNDVERLNTKQELDDIKDDITDLNNNKQDKLTAGSGITIDPETNEISSDVDLSDYAKVTDTDRYYVSEFKRYKNSSYQVAEINQTYNNNIYKRYAGIIMQSYGLTDPEAKIITVIDKSHSTPSTTDATNKNVRTEGYYTSTHTINQKYSKTIQANNSPQMTESLTLDSNNLYSKTINPSSKAVEETIKKTYTDANSHTITETRKNEIKYDSTYDEKLTVTKEYTDSGQNFKEEYQELNLYSSGGYYKNTINNQYLNDALLGTVQHMVDNQIGFTKIFDSVNYSSLSLNKQTELRFGYDITNNKYVCEFVKDPNNSNGEYEVIDLLKTGRVNRIYTITSGSLATYGNFQITFVRNEAINDSPLTLKDVIIYLNNIMCAGISYYGTDATGNFATNCYGCQITGTNSEKVIFDFIANNSIAHSNEIIFDEDYGTVGLTLTVNNSLY